MHAAPPGERALHEDDRSARGGACADPVISRPHAQTRARLRAAYTPHPHPRAVAKKNPQAIAALPEALQAEARTPDHTLVPVQRKVFTETAPIPRFEARLERADDDEVEQAGR